MIRSLTVAATVLTLTACAPPAGIPVALMGTNGPTTAATTETPVPVGTAWFDAAPYPREANGGVQVKAVVESVYDGDTATVVRLARTNTTTVVAERVKVRLAHIDAPELRTSDADEKRRGYAARDRLRALIPDGTVVTMYDLGPDKYGRTLAQIDTTDGRNAAQVLLEEGLVVPYEGGARG